MKYHRTTDTGRRLSAEPVVKPQPDMRKLVALVLHLADTLHAEAAAGTRNGSEATTSESKAPQSGVGGMRDDRGPAAPSTGLD